MFDKVIKAYGISEGCVKKQSSSVEMEVLEHSHCYERTATLLNYLDKEIRMSNAS